MCLGVPECRHEIIAFLTADSPVCTLAQIKFLTIFHSVFVILRVHDWPIIDYSDRIIELKPLKLVFLLRRLRKSYHHFIIRHSHIKTLVCRHVGSCHLTLSNTLRLLLYSKVKVCDQFFVIRHHLLLLLLISKD